MFVNKKVLVAGGTGLLGSAIAKEVLNRGGEVRIVVHNRPNPLEGQVEVIPGDLRNWGTCVKATRGVDFVVNCAALTGGLLRNKLDPASTYTWNIVVNTQLLEAARQAEVERYLFTSNISVYPEADYPVKEEEAWNGAPHESAVSAAWVRRMGELQASLYVQQYGMKIAITRGSSAYGPRDMFFDPEFSHVIPALIVRSLRKENPFVVWGTGESIRDFIYVEDLARGMVLALEKYATGDPINIGGGSPVKIKELVQLVLKMTGHEKARVIFATDKPLGPVVKVSDLSKAREKLGFSAQVSLEEGLRRTIDWYLRNKDYMKGYRAT